MDQCYKLHTLLLQQQFYCTEQNNMLSDVFAHTYGHTMCPPLQNPLQNCIRCKMSKDCGCVAVDIFCTTDTICSSLSRLFIIAMPHSLIFVSHFGENRPKPVIQMLASHAVIMQEFNSRFQGRDFVMERSKGEFKNSIWCLVFVFCTHRYAITMYSHHDYTHPIHGNNIHCRATWRSCEMFQKTHLCVFHQPPPDPRCCHWCISIPPGGPTNQ